MKYDLLVYLGLGVVIAGIIAGAYILRQTTAADVETSRIRFAAATSTGLLLAFIFTAILYFVDPSGPGKAIFDTAIAPIFSLGGAIIGSFFGKANNR
jgi:hypothetical protein